jgi:hypothetical protein
MGESEFPRQRSQSRLTISFSAKWNACSEPAVPREKRLVSHLFHLILAFKVAAL